MDRENMNDDAITLSACLDAVCARFEAAELWYGHGTDNAWDEAVYLVYSVLGLGYDTDPETSSLMLSSQQWQKIDVLAQRRIDERIPVAYLVGEAWFAGLPFKVDDRVLIPRSPFAELIEQRFASLLDAEPDRILDLCTGSGCIGIACALQFDQAQVVLADISKDALQLAAENSVRHAVGSRVSCVQSDLFASIEGRFDLIVCNPPYVSREELDEMPPEYRCEPELGLFSADNGLEIPLKILRQAHDYLTENGVLIMEVGYSQQALAERLPNVPLLWLEFACGGEGVLLMTRRQLVQFSSQFAAA